MRDTATAVSPRPHTTAPDREHRAGQRAESARGRNTRGVGFVTTLPIDRQEQVRTIVEYYCVRWCIEVFFRTLKLGCRIESRRFEHIDRLLPCLGVYLIVAWCTLFVCHMGRSCPTSIARKIFELSNGKAVWLAVKRTELPTQAPRLAEMVHLIASLGGYIERPKSEPGTQTLWICMQRMYDLALVWVHVRP